MFVHLDALLVVKLHTDLFCAQTVRERATPDRYKHLIGFEFQFFLVFSRNYSRATVVDLHAAYLCFQMECHALSSKQTLKKIRKLKIETKCDAGEKFQYRHLRTEPVPHRAQL